jgi:bacterioferritin-associated ferredoxin
VGLDQSQLTTILIKITVPSWRPEEFGMYVCLCNGVTEAAIRRAAVAGIRTLSDLANSTGCGAGCGCCVELAQAVLDEAHGAGDSPRAGHASGWIRQIAA